MKRSVTIFLAAALTAISGWGFAQQLAGVQTLRGADTAAADQAPDAQKAYTGKKPGLQKPIARTFKEQPPLVPHATDNFDEITVEENQCLSCHSLEKFKEKKAPKIGQWRRYCAAFGQAGIPAGIAGPRTIGSSRGGVETATAHLRDPASAGPGRVRRGWPRARDG